MVKKIAKRFRTSRGSVVFLVDASPSRYNEALNEYALKLKQIGQELQMMGKRK